MNLLKKYTWRVIYSPPATGAMNMAIDEAILYAVSRKEQLPTLRLYAWSPPCLSLGYAQPSTDVDLSRLHSLGWSIVRRPTGGRAILHADELTYSITAPLDHPLVAGSILESYSRLAKALLETLYRLGLPARADPQYDHPQGAQPGDPVCFEVPSNYEITVNGKKIIGSAQARRNGGVLQHGALPLFGDINRINWVLYYEDDIKRQQASERLSARATTVEAILHKPISWLFAAETMQTAFSDVFSIEFIKSDMSESEQHYALKLAEERYASPQWTFRV